MTVTETIHQYLLNCDEDLIVITQRTGIATSILSRMARNQTTPSSATIDALAEYFGLELQPARNRRGKASGTTKTTTSTTPTKATKHNTRKGN
jgi:hypothetical protein